MHHQDRQIENHMRLFHRHIFLYLKILGSSPFLNFLPFLLRQGHYHSVIGSQTYFGLPECQNPLGLFHSQVQILQDLHFGNRMLSQPHRNLYLPKRIL